jgi:cupin fold WbuC family metalloprotein
MSMDRLRWESPEVLYCEDEVPRLDADDVEALRGHATRGRRGRARICAHRNRGDALHEMFIAMDAGGYVRPHRHLGRAESFHVVSGAATIILFEDDGTARARLRLGDLASGRTFYFRLDRPVFHSLVVEAAPFVFHETTTGPFNPATSQGAPWAPEDHEVAAGRQFLAAALQQLEEKA